MVIAQGWSIMQGLKESLRKFWDEEDGCPVCSVHGGSAANVLKGLGNLALQQRSARFMGMVGLDDAGRCHMFLDMGFMGNARLHFHGVTLRKQAKFCTLARSSCVFHLLQAALLFHRQFHDHFKQQHVDPLLLSSSSGKATATCLCLVTPDGERTMRTHLGASSELESADQLPEGWTHNCRLLHCEGYCLYKLELTRGAMRAAKQSGAEVQTSGSFGRLFSKQISAAISGCMTHTVHRGQNACWCHSYYLLILYFMSWGPIASTKIIAEL